MKYREKLNEYRADMIKTLGESVAFRSVVSDAVRTTDGEVLPFGRDNYESLRHMLTVGKEMGFDTCNAENYGGHIQFNGTGADSDRKCFGIITHLDVVPEGTGWDTEPYKMTEKDGCLYGRGVADDKGPAVACLYAMKALKESGIEPKMDIRLVLGLDEETGKGGMRRYIELAGEPDLGITPDAEFPLINGEMGILIFDVVRKFNRQNGREGLRLTRLEAGSAPNAVPGTAKAVLAGDTAVYDSIKQRLAQYVLETGYDIRARKQGSSYVIESVGHAAHGAWPELGLNAISIMMDFLGRIRFGNDELNEFIEFYNSCIGFDLHGERLGCALEDDPSGKLILNVGMASFSEDLAQLTVNIRYPVTCTDTEVFEGIEEKLADSSIGIVKNMHDGPVFMDMDSPMVQQLIDTYREATGDNEAMPVVIGGGTYAKMFKNVLAYGAMFPGEEDTMHQPNERLSMESFFRMAEIYADAIYKICC